MGELAASRKTQIIEIAQKLFQEKGYASTSMRDLAKEVGIEPASLYSHFESKEGILKNICFRIAGEFFEIFEPINNSMVNPIEKLKRIFTEHIRVIVNNLDASTVFFNDWVHLQEPTLSEFKILRDKYENGIKSILQDGITSCELENIDIDFTTRLIFSALNGTHEWYSKEGRVSPEEVGERMSDFILNGISFK